MLRLPWLELEAQVFIPGKCGLRLGLGSREIAGRLFLQRVDDWELSEEQPLLVFYLLNRVHLASLVLVSAAKIISLRFTGRELSGEVADVAFRARSLILGNRCELFFLWKQHDLWAVTVEALEATLAHEATPSDENTIEVHQSPSIRHHGHLLAHIQSLLTESLVVAEDLAGHGHLRVGLTPGVLLLRARSLKRQRPT